jgi:hypothetical protein
LNDRDLTTMRQLITQLSNHACAVRRASDQSISNATTTDINFLAGATVEVDTDKMFDTSSSAKLTVKRNGLWLVGAHVLWENNGTGRRDLHLSVDGTVVVSERVDAATGLGNAQSVSTLLSLSADNVLTVSVRQSSGGALAVVAAANSPKLWAVRII